MYYNQSINIGRSMFDVQSVHCSGQAVFHTSPVASLKSRQFNRKRNFEKANIEYRIMNVEGMYSVYLKKD